MRVLLDTHVLLWWLADDPRLAAGIRAAIADGGNTIYVSSVSIAEIAIKTSLQKLRAPDGLLRSLLAEGFDELPLLSVHAERLADLPWHHRDPFDRMLVAQAAVEQLLLATQDKKLERYGVEVLGG